jgi:hypothetical protein
MSQSLKEKKQRSGKLQNLRHVCEVGIMWSNAEEMDRHKGETAGAL